MASRVYEKTEDLVYGGSLSSLPLVPRLSVEDEDTVNDRSPVSVKSFESETCRRGEAFVLFDVLTSLESQHLIRIGEELGFDKQGFTAALRSNLRVMVNAPELSEQLFERVRPFLADVVDVGERPEENGYQPAFRIKGRWKLKGLNTLWRLCKYEPGQHFGPHVDGTYVESSNVRSFKTFMLYLNGHESMEGGCTNFMLNDQGLHKNSEGMFAGSEESIVERLPPVGASALVFNHMILHEGEMLTGGVKYIMRSDVMYEREQPLVLDAKEEEGLRCFERAQTLESTKGKEMEAMELYRRAFKLCPELEFNNV